MDGRDKPGQARPYRYARYGNKSTTSAVTTVSRSRASPRRPRRSSRRNGNPSMPSSSPVVIRPRGTGGLQTRRWSKRDSKSWSHRERNSRGARARSHRRLPSGLDLNTGPSGSFQDFPSATPAAAASIRMPSSKPPPHGGRFARRSCSLGSIGSARRWSSRSAMSR